MKNVMIIILAITLIVALALGLAGCGLESGENVRFT